MDNNVCSYVTYLSNDRDYKGALLLNYNLKKLESKYNLSCIVLENVSVKICNILEKSGIVLHKYNLTDVLGSFNITDEYAKHIVRNHYYGKFIIFNLKYYSKIVYLDTDLLLTENIDHLFDKNCKDVVHMTYDVGERNNMVVFKEQMFNSGVIVTEPNENLYNKCYEVLKKYETNVASLGTDQTIFNVMNKVNMMHIEHLEYKYNCVSLLSNILNEHIENEHFYPAVVHFILHPKPWNYVDIDETIIDGKFYSNGEIYFKEWLKMYFEMVQKHMERTFEMNICKKYDTLCVENKMNELIPLLKYGKI